MDKQEVKQIQDEISRLSAEKQMKLARIKRLEREISKIDEKCESLFAKFLNVIADD